MKKKLWAIIFDNFWLFTYVYTKLRNYIMHTKDGKYCSGNT